MSFFKVTHAYIRHDFSGLDTGPVRDDFEFLAALSFDAPYRFAPENLNISIAPLREKLRYQASRIGCDFIICEIRGGDPYDFAPAAYGLVKVAQGSHYDRIGGIARQALDAAIAGELVEFSWGDTDSFTTFDVALHAYAEQKGVRAVYDNPDDVAKLGMRVYKLLAKQRVSGDWRPYHDLDVGEKCQVPLADIVEANFRATVSYYGRRNGKLFTVTKDGEYLVVTRLDENATLERGRGKHDAPYMALEIGQECTIETGGDHVRNSRLRVAVSAYGKRAIKRFTVSKVDDVLIVTRIE